LFVICMVKMNDKVYLKTKKFTLSKLYISGPEYIVKSLDIIVNPIELESI